MKLKYELDINYVLLDLFHIVLVFLCLTYFGLVQIDIFPQEQIFILDSINRLINLQEEQKEKTSSFPGAKFHIPRTIFGFHKNHFPHPIESPFSAHQK